jgi:hypothetical protein
MRGERRRATASCIVALLAAMGLTGLVVALVVPTPAAQGATEGAFGALGPADRSADQVDVTIQPGPDEGKDSYTRLLRPNTNYGSQVLLKTGSESTEPVDRWETWIQLDISDLPPDMTIVNAELQLRWYAGDEPYDYVYAVGDAWDEAEITWNNQPSSIFGFEGMNATPSGPPCWVRWGVTQIVTGWYLGQYPNDGFLIAPCNGESRLTYYRSSDYAYANGRPRLIITYE